MVSSKHKLGLTVRVYSKQQTKAGRPKEDIDVWICDNTETTGMIGWIHVRNEQQFHFELRKIDEYWV